MTPRFRTTVLASTVAALFVLPAVADAQARRAVPRGGGVARVSSAPRVIRSRPAVRVGVYYGPSIYYRPWYASPYGWYDPFYGYPYYSQWYPPYYGQGYYGRGYYDLSSSLRLQVSPKEAEVFIDGYYAGTVDNFDGVFQRLHLEPGEHDLELFLPGHRSFTQKIYLQPLSTFRVRHAMEPLGAGEAEPLRPVGTPSSSAGAPSQAGPVGPGPERPGTERPPARGPQRPAPPRARERAPNAEADFGSIALRVQPGDATITIDGERWDGAQDQERLVVQLAAGTHNVEIRKDGYRTYITDIIVRRGETTPLNVSLTRQ